MRGFEVRKVTNDGKRLGIEGYGIEIISVRGSSEHTGRVYLGREGANDGGFDEQAYVIATPGERRLGYFQDLRYDTGTSPGSSDPDWVKVRVFTDPKTVWVDAPPTGKVRTKYFARTPGADQVGAPLPSLLAGAAVVLYNGALPENISDAYWDEERADVQVLHRGIITADGAFTVWVYTKVHVLNGSSVYRCVQQIASRSVAGSAAANAVAAGFAGNVVDFTVGAGAATVNVALPIPFPAGNVKIVLENTGGAPITYEYMLGCKSHY